MALLWGQPYQAQAQFPRAESFQNSTAGGFVLGGSATLTAASGGDPNGAGYLRLTSATANQSGFAIDQTSFLAPSGFSISFEFFAYGGNGADGFSVFLVDADRTSAASFTPGASGGSLGYAQKVSDPVSNGVPFGYIGIGIDEFGNYSNATEGRVGGINTPELTPNAVAIRGAGNGQSTTDYPYLAGSPTLPFKLDVPTVRAQAGSSDYRRVYIDVVPVNGTYRITVRIQHGAALETAVRDFVVPAPPKNLRIGFAGSTGGRTNVHEIRKLAVQQLPFLRDDVAGTAYNQPVSINVLNNDTFTYAPYKAGSVDLDLNTPGVQSSLTLAQGTFLVTPEGIVTFTPSGTFAGAVTLPYTAGDMVDQTASPANIIVVVRGADIANSVSGPTAASPGARVQYTVTTSNLGPLPATNVAPTLQLPAGLGSVVVGNGGAYDAVSGLVTFTASNLAAGGTPATNTVSFTAPASGSVTGTTANTATEPDPVASNNVASITTLISGLANVASVCATPGKDGVGNLGATSAPNTYFAGQRVTTSGNAASIVLGPALTGVGAATTPIAAGDLVLVMQMQGAPFNTDNSAAYGSGNGNGNGSLNGSQEFTAGLYEYAVATTAVATGGGTLVLDRALANAYDNLDYSDAANPTGQRRFQVVRVPQYSALAVADSVAGAPWNGTAGGVLALDVAGSTTFAPGARLTMTGRGFRGGGGKQYTGVGTGTTSYSNTDFRQLSSATTTGTGGAKGEGTGGTPAYLYDGPSGALVSTGQEGYRSGSNGRGGPGNAGGGGTDESPTDNSRNTGGGGGANGGQGGFGGYGYGYTGNMTDNAQGIGGAAFGASAGRLALGGGGGAGSANDAGLASSGAAGGGIVLLRTGAVAGAGQVLANGLNAGPAANDGGGGGGAGGAVLVLAANASTLGALTVTAHGGKGGNANVNGAQPDAAHGTGGGGGGGTVFTNGAVASSSSAAGGANGTTTTGALAFGATTGTAGAFAADASASGSGTAACLPALTVALSTSTPGVTRTGGSAGPVDPALYTLTVANTGGTATGVSALGRLASSLFTYDGTYTPVATLILPDGRTATPTGYGLPADGVSQPTFTGFVLPAGASLTITFRATIDASAQNGVAYQASAEASYDNPLRTSAANATAQPGQNYSGTTDTGLGTAGGSDYSSSSSTAEDVTIQVPLPVSLARFTAVAARLDAQLRWTTASEHNNDRFVVERSADNTAFEAVGTVRGQGNSSRAFDYAFLDAGAARHALAGRPLYYRLRQVDSNGETSYSPVRTVAFQTGGTAGLYPNPASATATLDLSNLPAGPYQVQVLDLTGRVVAAYSLAGGAQHPLNLRALAVGTYLVRVHGGATSQSLLLTHE
ncbi:T9SS type A sorting domain-containing protein [Hymenobacter nivis]|nr:T9SS type A sorting domain-containing protein [Hymenobacter nivis]